MLFGPARAVALNLSSMRIAAVVITKNEERNIEACLRSVHWADEAIVVDACSEDRTVSLARRHTDKVFIRPWPGFGPQKNYGIDQAAADWILILDADERVPEALRDEIIATIRHPAVQVGFEIPRRNVFYGRPIRGGGLYPDYQLRLLRRTQARYDSGHPVHEIVKLAGAAGYLSTPLIHINYETVTEFIAKQKYYAAYDAQGLAAAGVRAKARHFLLQPLRHFYWRWIQLAGWRGGWHSLRLSLLMSYFEYEKYRILANVNHQC